MGFSLVLAAVSVALALLAIQIPLRVFGAPAASGRFATIDGLRGYLAFGVFLHHAANWPGYAQTGVWVSAPGLFHHMGSSAVLMFFMITAFLFYTQLLNASTRPMDWLRLFVGRALRLGPLYLVAMLVLALLVAQASGFVLREDPVVLLKNSLHWLAFTLARTRDLNGVENTHLIMAGVTWTLRYEWMFYLALPLLAVCLRRRVPVWLVLVCLTVVVALLMSFHIVACLLAFGVGIVAAHLVRWPRWRRMASSRTAACLVISVLLVALLALDESYSPLSVALTGLAFALIAGGCSLGGVLTAPTSRQLGEAAYGIYLLHGFVLYVAYRLVAGPWPAGVSITQWAVLTWACTPVVVLVSYGSYRWLERPALAQTARLTQWLRSRCTPASRVD